MKTLTDTNQISQKEIDQIKAKHVGVYKAVRKAFWQALEIGEWFLESRKRLGIKNGGHGGIWKNWLDANFPEIGYTTIVEYVRLAKNRQFLEVKFNLNSTAAVELQNLPGIREALHAIAEKNAEENPKRRKSVIDIESAPGNGTEKASETFTDDRPTKILPPPEVQVDLKEQGIKIEDPDDDPITRLSKSLKSYVYELDTLKYHAAQVCELIRLAELSKKHVKSTIEWACRDHPELQEEVEHTFYETN